MSDLLRPDRRLVSLDEASGTVDETKIPELDRPNAFVTRAWALECFAKVTTAMTEQLYDQFGKETAVNLARMEQVVTERVLARVELERRRNALWRRALRWAFGHWRALLIRLGAEEPVPSALAAGYLPSTPEANGTPSPERAAAARA